MRSRTDIDVKTFSILTSSKQTCQYSEIRGENLSVLESFLIKTEVNQAIAIVDFQIEQVQSGKAKQS